MDYIRRVYVAGVGYTCYLTEVNNLLGETDVLNKTSKLDNPSVNSVLLNEADKIKGVQATRIEVSKSLTEGLSKKNLKKEISVANYTNYLSATQNLTDNLVKVIKDKQKGPAQISPADLNNELKKKGYISYFLNLKVGYSDLKSIDITNYITDQKEPLEILVVGKEILTTPGYQEILSESEPTTGAVVSPIKAIIIIRGTNKEKVNSLAASIRNIRPYSVYKGIGLRLQGEPLNIKVVVKNKQKG